MVLCGIEFILYRRCLVRKNRKWADIELDMTFLGDRAEGTDEIDDVCLATLIFD